MTIAASQPFVSVLTPFYNEEKYLSQCITSVIGQTHSNFELILVDNCSTDGSVAIAKDFSSRDSRIRLVRNPALVSQMENLNIAAGLIGVNTRYVKYCFGDDWLYSNCLERMVDKLEANPSAGSVCAYTLVETEVFPHGPHPRDSVITGREAARRYLLNGTPMFGSPTASMFRAEVVCARPTFFNPNRSGDDIEPQMDSFLNWDFAFVHEVLSFTRRELQTTSGRLNRLLMLHASAPICLYKYGPQFLDDAEFREALRTTNRYYGRQLSRAAIKGNLLEVLRAHSNEMARSGYTLPKAAIARGLLERLIELLLNPHHTAISLMRQLRR